MLRYLVIVALFVIPTTAFSQADPPSKITVGTWNLEWFYDDYTGDNRAKLAKKLAAPNKNEWQWRLNKIAGVIAQLKPTILALQEVENQQVVYDLTQKLSKAHGIKYRIAFIQGYDFFTEQDVAIIYQDGLVEYSRKEQTKSEYNSNKFRNVSKHLFAKFQWGDGNKKQTLHIANVHLRATPEKEDYRKKQCRLVHHWMKEKLDAGENVIILGDLNTEHKAGTYDKNTDIGIMAGRETVATTDDLVDLHTKLPGDQQFTHMIDRSFDRMLVSASLMADDNGKADMVVSRVVTRSDLVIQGKKDKAHRDVYYKIDRAERDLSDHYPMMAEILIK